MGRSSIPQASVIEPRGRGVLDTPHARGITPVGGDACSRVRGEESLPRLRGLQPARQHGPIGGGEETLQQVHHAGVVADQDARLVVLDALDDALRGGSGRGSGDAVEPLDRSCAALIVGHADAGAGVADDVGGDAAGVHHGDAHRARRRLQFMPQAFRKTAHREFRGRIRRLPRRRDDPENAGEVDDVGLALARKLRQERARRMHHAPEIDVDQPLHLRLVDLVELAEQGDAGIVDDDVEARMGGARSFREGFDLAGFGDVDAVHGDFSRMGFGDLGGDRLQSCLVAVRQRKIAAARRQLKRQRPADAAGGAGEGGGGSTDRSHLMSPLSERFFCAKNFIWLAGLGNRAKRVRIASGVAAGMIWAKAMSISFLVTSLIVIISPGTGVLYTLAAALTKGSRASIAAAFGCTLGIVPHMSAAMLGLAAVLHTSALAFAALKWCGVAYLLYMAWQALRERGALAIEPRLDARSRGKVIVTGFLINILNPKLSIFFLAFLPQFIAADEGHPLLKMLELSGVFMAMTFAVFVVYGLFAAFVRDRIVTRPEAMAWLRRAFATGFAALGARLALAE